MTREKLVKALKALANENRLKILETIEDEQAGLTGLPENIEVLDLTDEARCSVDEIMNRLKMAQSSASQHLKELHNAGLLRRHKQAQWVYYSIDPDMLENVVEDLIKFSPPKKKVTWAFYGIENELLEQSMEYMYLHDTSYTHEQCA